MARTKIDPSLIPSLQSAVTYRRPRLAYGSASTVGTDVQIAGSPNLAVVIFPDGEMRSEGTARDCPLTQNAVLTTSGKQGGLRSSLTEAADTWYAIYAVKVTDGPGWCLVGDTVTPSHTTISTLNGYYGTNGWVYLGMIRNGDGSAVTTDIVNFLMSGSMTLLANGPTTLNGGAGLGIRLAASAAATTTWTYATGTSGAVLPDHIFNVFMYFGGSNSGANTEVLVRNSAATAGYGRLSNLSGNRWAFNTWCPASNGFQIANASFGSGNDINVAGWSDTRLAPGFALI